MHNAQPATEQHLTELEHSFGESGMLSRYARGRVAHFANRQIVTLVGGAVLLVMNGWQIGVLAVLVAVCGEIIDCLYLRRVPERLKQGAPVARIYALSTITATIQAVTIAFCVSLSWFGQASQFSPLFAIAFLAGAAVNGGLVMPYHRAAAVARLAVYAVSLCTLFVNDALHLRSLEIEFVMDSAGALLLAYMVYLFLQFVNRGYQRNGKNMLALTEQSHALEVANKQLRERQKEAERLSLVAKHANDSVILIDVDGRIAWVNDAFTRITGFTPDQAIGQMPGDLLNGPQTKSTTTQALQDAVAAGQPFRGEIQNVTRDGRVIWIETNQVPVLDADGNVEMMVAIERDITAAKESARELSEAKRAAEDGARAKAEFLATMSHEIRTPMNGVIGMADLMCETDLNEDQELYANTIRSSAGSLLTIINDILDLSKLDAQKLELSPVDFDMQACLGDTIRLLRPKAVEKGLELDLVIDAEMPGFVQADDGRIRQVLINLIGNAIKFTDAGRVSVRARTVSTGGACQLHVDVQDTGIGIDQDKLDHVFERFLQADAATTRRFGGTGLGLTISRMLVEAMGGKISVTSRPGEGSCFSVMIPLNAGKDRPEAASVPGHVDEQVNVLHGMQVLVAEDNKVNRLVMSKFLKDTQIELRFAHDGQQVVDMVLSDPPDLVFMDMSMPKLSGIEATEQIRAKAIRQPVIVALTANAFDSDKVACLEAGMDGFLTKPVRRPDLLTCMAKYRDASDVSAAR